MLTNSSVTASRISKAKWYQASTVTTSRTSHNKKRLVPNLLQTRSHCLLTTPPSVLKHINHIFTIDQTNWIKSSKKERSVSKPTCCKGFIQKSQIMVVRHIFHKEYKATNRSFTVILETCITRSRCKDLITSTKPMRQTELI